MRRSLVSHNAGSVGHDIVPLPEHPYGARLVLAVVGSSEVLGLL